MKKMQKVLLFLLPVLLLGVFCSCEKEEIEEPEYEFFGDDEITMFAPDVGGDEELETGEEQKTFQVDDNGVLQQNIHLKGKRGTDFELPIKGATGFISYPLTLWREAEKSTAVAELSPGDAFVIKGETKKQDLWCVQTEDGKVGWIENETCFLNIPDVIPSICIENTNATQSVFISSGKDIPGITGEKLYESLYENPRFSGEIKREGEVIKRHIVAANYNMVKKIYKAQQIALNEGYTLVINETYRPLSVQKKVASSLADLRLKDKTVKKGIDQKPWGIAWFISPGMSTHQMGCAMDVTLAKVSRIVWYNCGEYLYPKIESYSVVKMPTQIHELSGAAASLSKPVSADSATEWLEVEVSDSMTEGALRLRLYCTNAKLYPLASEWWHFNDLDAKKVVKGKTVSRDLNFDCCLSQIPE